MIRIISFLAITVLFLLTVSVVNAQYASEQVRRLEVRAEALRIESQELRSEAEALARASP